LFPIHPFAGASEKGKGNPTPVGIKSHRACVSHVAIYRRRTAFLTPSDVAVPACVLNIDSGSSDESASSCCLARRRQLVAPDKARARRMRSKTQLSNSIFRSRQVRPGRLANVAFSTAGLTTDASLYRCPFQRLPETTNGGFSRHICVADGTTSACRSEHRNLRRGFGCGDRTFSQRLMGFNDLH
jgi:hypothetical protein